MNDAPILTAQCRACGVRLRVKSHLPKKVIACPKCNAPVTAIEPREAQARLRVRSREAVAAPVANDVPEEAIEQSRKREVAFRQQSLALGIVWVLKGLGYGLLAAVAIGGYWITERR